MRNIDLSGHLGLSSLTVWFSTFLILPSSLGNTFLSIANGHWDLCFSLKRHHLRLSLW
jgi:hypothetical protein